LGPLWKDADPDIPVLKEPKAEYVICWKQHRPAPGNSVINSVMNGVIKNATHAKQPATSAVQRGEGNRASYCADADLNVEVPITPARFAVSVIWGATAAVELTIR